MDLFYEKSILTPAEIQSLKIKSNGGSRLLVAYINIGAAETFRYYWKGNPPYLVKPYGEGYADEYITGYWTPEWQKIIFNEGDTADPEDNSYIKKIINAGFDGAYLDNLDSYKRIF